MNIQAHDRALNAAIRLALGTLVLAGCAETVATTSEETESSDLTSTKPSKKAKDAGATAADAGSSAHECPGSKPEPKSCDMVFASAFPDGGSPDWWAMSASRSEPELVRCCSELTNVESANPDYYLSIEKARSVGCCDVDFPGMGAACTPWGPPVPPAMPWSFLAEVA